MEFLFILIGSAFITAVLAVKKRRNPVVWFVAGLLFTWIALIVLAMVLPKPRRARGPIPTAADDLNGMLSRGTISVSDAEHLRRRIEKLPSRSELRLLFAQTLDQSRREARNLALWVHASFGACVLGTAIICGANGDAGDFVGVLLLGELLFGMWPGFAVYWLQMRDIGAIDQLLESGTIYPGRIAANPTPMGSTHIRVGWIQDGEACSAIFDLSKRPDRIALDVTVVAERGYPMAAVLLNGDQIHAARVVRQYHLFKRRRPVA